MEMMMKKLFKVCGNGKSAKAKDGKFFEDKMEAKEFRNFLNGGRSGDGEFHVSYGPDHRHFNVNR